MEDVKDYILFHTAGHLYWKDTAGKYLGCNKEFSDLLGLSDPGDIRGKTDYDLLKDSTPKKEIDKIFRMDKRVIETGAIELQEEQAMDKKGDTAFYITKKIPLKNKTGDIIGLVGTSMDITHLKKAEEDLKKALDKAEIASQAKSAFIASMSHDIRTPITGIVGMAQDLLNTTHETRLASKKNTLTMDSNAWSALVNDLLTRVEEDSHILMASVDQLLQLCNEILEVTRLESGVSEQVAESFDLHDLTERTLALLQPVASHKKLLLYIDVDKEVPRYVKGWRNYTDRILLNLMGNALKFTEKGSVTLRIKQELREGEAVRVQMHVEDTGIGIPEDKFEAIFGHFSRLTPSYEGIYKGSGLGLYMTKRYVEAMKGSIELQSKIGQGSCFTVTLPFTISDAPDRPSLSACPSIAARSELPVDIRAPSSVNVSLSSFCILVVEDNKVAAMAVKVILKPLGCALDVAENGTQAVDKAKNNTYDFILMDIGLPDISGIEATQAIRSFPDTQKASVPIIALTGHADDPTARQKCLEAGMQEVLRKPAQTRDLEAVFQRFARSVLP